MDGQESNESCSLDSGIAHSVSLDSKGLWIQTSHNIASRVAKPVSFSKTAVKYKEGQDGSQLTWLIWVQLKTTSVSFHSSLFSLPDEMLKPVTFYWCIAVPQEPGQRQYVLDNVIKACGGKIKGKETCFSLLFSCSNGAVCFFQSKTWYMFAGTPLWIYCEPFCCHWKPWLKTQSSKLMDLCWSSTGVISHLSKLLNSLQACWDWPLRAYR